MVTPRDQRFRVHLAVRFDVARDFVVEYAENLSRGGLFLVGMQHLALGQEVSVTLELLGAGSLTVHAEVAHILTPAAAAQAGRRPGTGLQITSSPPGFAETMTHHLQRLGRRRDVVVMVSEAASRELLIAAGYQVRPVPPLEEFASSVIGSDAPVVGVVVPSDLSPDYADAAAEIGAPALVHAADNLAETEALIGKLDAAL